MIGRLPIAVLALAGGIAVASLIPEIPRAVRDGIGLVSGTDRMTAAEPAEAGEQRGLKGGSRTEAGDEQQANVSLTANQIETAGIELAPVQDGTLTRQIIVPGTIVPHADRIARVSVRLPAMVTELRKRLGEQVDKGEVVAVLESREVADAKSDYLAARLNNDLQQDLFEREKALWDKRISSEQQWLRARNATATAKMRFDIARQKLFALGVTASEIAGLPEQPETTLRRHEVLAPMSGRIVDRKVELGTIVGREQSGNRTLRHCRSRPCLGRTRRQSHRPSAGPGRADRVGRGARAGVSRHRQHRVRQPDAGPRNPFRSGGGRDRQSRRQLAAGLPGPLYGRDRGTLHPAHRAGKRRSDHRQGPSRIRAHD
jgi:multidrug efflux pump subunit AcrA (membrane-fusion protein)